MSRSSASLRIATNAGSSAEAADNVRGASDGDVSIGDLRGMQAETTGGLHVGNDAVCREAIPSKLLTSFETRPPSRNAMAITASSAFIDVSSLLPPALSMASGKTDPGADASKGMHGGRLTAVTTGKFSASSMVVSLTRSPIGCTGRACTRARMDGGSFTAAGTADVGAGPLLF
jgi:hypothetical protein